MESGSCKAISNCFLAQRMELYKRMATTFMLMADQLANTKFRRPRYEANVITDRQFAVCHCSY